VKLEFPVTTINEAMLTATEKWRVLVEDPEATLPWSTHFSFDEESHDEAMDGTVLRTQTVCTVLIEFDRKVIDELTGANMTMESDESVKAV
jgi:hypothetical protein